MALAPGMAFFSTEGGQFLPRPVPTPPNEPIVREILTYHWDVAQHANFLRELYPHECNQIFKDFYDIGDYFDPYDRQLLGTGFLKDVLQWIARENEMSCSIFMQFWAEQNEEKVIQVRNGKGLEVFSNAEIEERGRMFLTYALTMVRKFLIAWADKHQADSGQAMEAQHTEAGRGPSPLDTLLEEPSEVPAPESQAVGHDESVPLAHSPLNEDGSRAEGQPSKRTLALTKGPPKPEAHIIPSDESKTQEAAAKTTSSMDEAKAGEPSQLTSVNEIVPPTPMSTVSTPAAPPNDSQKLSPCRQVKSQASMYRPPAVFSYNRGPHGPPFQSPAATFLKMNNDPRNHRPAPIGFMSPPSLQNSLDQMMMTGQGFAPMQGQPMMHSPRFPSGNQWQNGMPIQQNYPYAPPPRLTGRNAPESHPVYISNALKADMSRQGTPQLQNPFPVQQGPFVPQSGLYGPPFSQNSPYMESATLGSITNQEIQFGPQGDHKRRASGARNDYYLPPTQRDDGVFVHPNPTDFVVQTVKDRRSSFAGPPPRRGRRSSLRGGLTGTFHTRRPSDNVPGLNNVQTAAVNTEPFPAYNPLSNPNTVYVANFPEIGNQVEQETILRRHFSIFIGKDVENVSVGVGKTMRRYAHINFFHEDDVKEALKLHDTEFMGMPLQVNLKRIGGPHRRNVSGNFGFRTIQSNRDAPLSIVHREPSFSKSPATFGAGYGFANHQRSGTDRRSSTASKSHSLGTKYSPQDARSLMVAEESASLPVRAPQSLTGQAGGRPRKADGSTTGSSKSGRSTPTTVNQGSTLTVRKKSRREETAPAKSEGDYEKIKTIFEEAVSSSEVKELTLNPKNELVDESGKVVYKVKVPEQGKETTLASDKLEPPTTKEQHRKSSPKSSPSRQSSPVTTRSSSVSGNKTLKQGGGELPATPDSQDDQKSWKTSRVSYAKAAANLQTPEKSSQKPKSKPGLQAADSKATANTRATAKGISALKGSSEGDESFVSAQEDMSAPKKKKRAHKSKGKNKSRPGTPSASSAASQAGDRPSSAASLATVARPPSANKWVELTPSDKSTAEADKPQVIHRAPTAKIILKKSDVAGSGYSLPPFDMSICDEPTKPLQAAKSGEAPNSVETLSPIDAPKFVEASKPKPVDTPKPLEDTLKSVYTLKPVDTPKPVYASKSVDTTKSADAPKSVGTTKFRVAPTSSDVPEVFDASAASDVTDFGDTQRPGTAMKSNASDSSVSDEKFYTPPPQKEKFEATVEKPMQERPANVEASSSKSGPKQTPSIHPFARQKESKRKLKSKRSNKKEQQKGPSTTNPVTMTTETTPQVLSEHLSSDQSLSTNEDSQHIKSHQSILDSRPMSLSPTSQATKLDPRLTPESSTVYKIQQLAMAQSGPSIMKEADMIADPVKEGGQSGDKAPKTFEKNSGMVMELQVTDEDDSDAVAESSVVGAEDTPAGESIDLLRTAENVAGESGKTDEMSISRDSHLSLLRKQSVSAAEDLQNFTSDASDVAPIDLDAREKTRARRRAKTKRQQLNKKARKAVESQDAPPISSGDENEQHSDGLETVDCPIKNPILMPKSVYDKTPAPRGQRLKRFGNRSANKYAATVLINEHESRVDMEHHKTAPRFGVRVESEFPQPFPPPRSSLRDRLYSIIDARVAGNGKLSTASKDCEVFPASNTMAISDQQGVGGLFGSSEDAFNSPTPFEKNKGKGKCREDELDDPLVEGANVEPGMPPIPENDSRSEADEQSDPQSKILECLNSHRRDESSERMEAKDLVDYLNGIRAITSLLAMGAKISDFTERLGDNGSEEGNRAREELDSEAETEIEENGKAEQAKHDDGEVGKTTAAASGSEPKPARKNKKSEGKKKKGKKKW